MPELWILLLALGATARITRLITSDTITRPWRDRIARRYGDASLRREFVGCPWCVGFWVSAAVMPVAFCPYLSHRPAFLITATALTASWLYAIAAINLDSH